MPRGLTPAVLSIANWQGRIWALVGIPIVCGIAIGTGLHLGATYLALVALASIGLFYRCWRTGVRFDGHGVTIRRYLRTDRLKWAEVSHLADGHAKITVAEKTSDGWHSRSC
jgi:hypothetical protein